MRERTHFKILGFFLLTLLIANLFFGLGIKRVEWALGASTFLFGTLAGYAIKKLSGRKKDLRESFMEESSLLRSIYLLFKKGRNKEMAKEKIDDYITKVLSFPIEEYKKSSEEFSELFGLLEVCKGNYKENFYEILTNLAHKREKIKLRASNRLPPYLKTSLYVFGLTSIYILFLMKTNSLWMSLFSAFFIIGVFVILIIIEDLEHLRDSETAYWFSTIEQVFDLMGKRRFYYEGALDLVDEVPDEYRLLSDEGEVYLVRDGKKVKVIEEVDYFRDSKETDLSSKEIKAS